MCEKIEKEKKNKCKKTDNLNDTVETGNSDGAVSSLSFQKVKYRNRHFQFTLNQPEKYEELKNLLCEYSTLKYFISCEETAPTTGHKHIHIYVQYSQPKTLDVRNYLGAHLESCKGTPQENRNYIIKEGKILDELGTFKQAGGCSGLSIKQIMNMKEEDIFENVDFKYYNVVKKIKEDNDRLRLSEQHKDISVLYFYGKSGQGKSYNASKVLIKLCEIYGWEDTFDEVKYENNFWLGTHKNEIKCVYDDFRDSDMKPNEFIKFIDYNKHVMNIKGGERINNYKVIVITSIKSPWELYEKKSDEEKKQWIRRMKIYRIKNGKFKRMEEEEVVE